MATKTKSGGGGAAMLTMPEGYDPAAAKHYAEGVAARFDTLLPTAGVVRLLLVTRKGAEDADVRAAVPNPRMGLKKKAPGVFEALAMPKDMDAVIAPNVGDGKLFRWVDLAHRCYGAPVHDAAADVPVAIAYEGTPAEAKKKLASLGMTVVERTPPPDAAEMDGGWVDPDEGYVTGTIPGGKIADLVLNQKVLAIEIRAKAE